MRVMTKSQRIDFEKFLLADVKKVQCSLDIMIEKELVLVRKSSSFYIFLVISNFPKIQMSMSPSISLVAHWLCTIFLCLQMLTSVSTFLFL